MFEGIPVFWPIIILVGIVVMAISARFFFRIALFLFSLFAIWFLLHFVGLVPSPINFFDRADVSETIEQFFPAKKDNLN